MSEEKNTKFCSHCGAEIYNKARVCIKCGVEQPIIPENISNWWYVFAFLGGIIGGVIAWAINKDRNPKKAVRFIFTGLVLPIAYLAFSLFVVFTSMGGAKEKAKDAGVIASMNQLQMTIEWSFWDKSFSEINCSSPDLSMFCNNIKTYAGQNPTIKSSEQNYCFYVKLLNGNYYCLSNNLSLVRETKIFPGLAGYCDGITFSCP